MTATLPTRHNTDKAGAETASPKKTHYSRAAQSLAQKLGFSEHYVEKLLRAKTGLNIRCAELITDMLAHGAIAQELRFFEVIRRAHENRKPAALTLKLVESASDACHAEHIAELRYLATKSDADLSMDIRATGLAILRLQQLHDAQLAEEQGRMSRQS